MTDIKSLQAERDQIFNDFYNYRLPKRLPVSAMFGAPIIAQYSNVELTDAQYNFKLLKEGAEELCERVYSDTCPISIARASTRFASFYQLLGAKTFKMSSSGFMQHPNVEGMLVEDYEYFIQDPYACIIERVIPRLFKNLDPSSSADIAKTIPMAMDSNTADTADALSFIKPLIEKHGYYLGAPAGSGGFTAAPYDFLADQLRSFSGISKDIRRNRTQIIEACEALYPLMFNLGLPANPSLLGSVGTPLHMPTYMREKDFAEVWLPTYKRLCEEYASLGVRVSAFCEHDWMRYLDILTELPAGMVLRFEYGDPQTIKDKLGKKFIIGGLYPLELLKKGTKQQVIDKAKELLDIMMPGGGYMFGFDKGPLVLHDINIENYIALTEFVRDYAVYPNAGESYGTPLNSEQFSFDLTDSLKIKSKYMHNWDEFKQENPFTPDFAKAKFEKYDMNMFKFYLNLFV
ncbi:MAG: hypothetical protein NUK65_12335 [Firmicutes bacterium]|nr:hypothetical protein [Bacillota bacterium]